jgi:PIN domain nuclease of toxin-antitoxin system
MKILLDTLAFLWWVSNDPQLSATATKTIQNSENTIYFSAASAWEIAIKAKLGRLTVKRPVPRWIADQLRKNSFTSLSIEVRHATHVYRLPDIHRDPFDRILIAQSQVERIQILTNDPEIAKYDVRLLW